MYLAYTRKYTDESTRSSKGFPHTHQKPSSPSLFRNPFLPSWIVSYVGVGQLRQVGVGLSLQTFAPPWSSLCSGLRLVICSCRARRVKFTRGDVLQKYDRGSVIILRSFPTGPAITEEVENYARVHTARQRDVFSWSCQLTCDKSAVHPSTRGRRSPYFQRVADWWRGIMEAPTFFVLYCQYTRRWWVVIWLDPPKSNESRVTTHPASTLLPKMQ